MHLIFGMFIFVIMLLVSTMMLLGWVATRIVGWIFRGITSLFPVAMTRTLPVEPLPSMCRRDGCHAANPTEARFCRRCGVALEQTRYGFVETAPQVSEQHKMSAPRQPIAI